MTVFSFEVNQGVKTIDDLARQDTVAIPKPLQQYMERTSSAAGVAFVPLINPFSDDGKEAKTFFRYEYIERLDLYSL